MLHRPSGYNNLLITAVPFIFMFQRQRIYTNLDDLPAGPMDISVSCMSERTVSIGRYFVVSANQKAENKR
jgi:hypothetical protein